MLRKIGALYDVHFDRRYMGVQLFILALQLNGDGPLSFC